MELNSVVLALAFGHLSLWAALLFADHGQPRSRTWSTWSLAKQCQAAAWLLLYLRGVIPDLCAILLGNLLLFAGVALDAGALWQVAGAARWRRVLLPLLALAGATFLVIYALDLPPTLRSTAGALVVGGFFAASAAAMARSWRTTSMLHRYLALVMAALAVVLAGRCAQAALWPDGVAWLTPALMQMGSVGALYLMMLSNGFGYLLLARAAQREQLERLEVIDSVTGVPNRRGFYQSLGPWMALARRPGMPTALVVLNLDHFKRVNDNYGHQVGDMLLVSMVEVCRKQLRDSDLMGRLGGADFAIQLPRTAPTDALMVAERIRAAIAGMPFKTERAVLSLTASLGVTSLRAEDSTVSLFKRADEALQAAKLAGRNCVVEAAGGLPLAE